MISRREALIMAEELCRARKVTKEKCRTLLDEDFMLKLREMPLRGLPFGQGLISMHCAKEAKIGVRGGFSIARPVAPFPIPKLKVVDSISKVDPVFITREEEKECVVPRKFDLEDIKILYQELSIATQNLEFKWGEMRVPREITGNLGLSRIGSGAFSECFEVIGCSDKVVKIGFRKEDAYSAYIAYCRQHQGEEGIPNIHFVSQLANGMLFTVLDRLKEDSVYYSKVHVEEFVKDRLDYHGLRFEGNYNIPKVFRKCYKGDFKALQKTIDDIIVFFKDIARIDLHRGNYMFTQEGKVVITDPVSYTADYLKKGGYKIQSD